MFKTLGVICGIVLAWFWFQKPSGSGDVASRQTLSISEQPDSIVLGWSGPVQAPMSEHITAALDRYRDDRRRLVLILNSPGGSIEHGRKVVAAIHARDRAIETLVQKSGVCASMCVPIFLAGTKRLADPEAYFMFHQASLRSSARETIKREELDKPENGFFREAVKAIESQATDDLFRNDIGPRGVSPVWLAMMRKKIAGRDIWMSAEELMKEGSGIVDGLVRTPAG